MSCLPRYWKLGPRKRQHTSTNLSETKVTSPLGIVDVGTIQCVVSRVCGNKRWYIIDRNLWYAHLLDIYHSLLRILKNLSSQKWYTSRNIIRLHSPQMVGLNAVEDKRRAHVCTPVIDHVSYPRWPPLSPIDAPSNLLCFSYHHLWCYMVLSLYVSHFTTCRYKHAKLRVFRGRKHDW